MPKLHIFKNEKETCQAFAGWLAGTISEALVNNEKFTIAIAQGDIPAMLYKILATEYADKIEWSKVHVFAANHRLVSNVSSDTTFNDFTTQLSIPKEQVHNIPTNLSHEEAIAKYEALLQQYFDGEPAFDLAILSMGEDGSFLSFHAGDDDNNVLVSNIVAIQNKVDNTYSITLTKQAINAAKMKAFLVTGKKKEDAVQQVLNGKYDPEKYPAQLIVTTDKTVHWFFDEAAAAKLIKPTP
ncbi:MAG TPA: 6-phosphogluconolactonase [Segetibacter sp.]|jgi:6-phosphogluconolactonase